MATKHKWDSFAKRWLRQAQTAQRRYVRWATIHRRLYWAIGVPTIMLGAATGTAVLQDWASPQHTSLKLVAQIVSVLAAIFIAYQTFAQHDKRAEESQTIADRYERFCRELDFRAQFAPQTDSDAEKIFEDLNRAYGDLPGIGSRVTYKRKRVPIPTLSIILAGEHEVTVKTREPVSAIDYGRLLWDSTEDRWPTLVED